MNRAQRRNVAKSRNPRDIAALGEHYQHNGQTRKAEEAYREAIARDPSCVEAVNNLGQILQERGRISEATAQFIRARELRPDDVRIAINLARAFAAQNRFHDAAALFRQAVSLDPRFAEARFGLALALSDLGEHAQAEPYYRQALQIDPTNPTVRIYLGLTLAAQGKIADAHAQAEILAQAVTAPGFPCKAFGILLSRIGCPDDARTCFEAHLLRHPGDADEVAMLLAAVGGALPERASDRQLAKIYTARADQWDHGAAGAIGYQGHRLVAAALEELGVAHAGTVIDLGCGTGLVGELLRTKCDRLIGIDLSEPMLAQARQKKIYDELDRADLLEWLRRREGPYDIIVSAATLIHFGDLNAVFAAAAKCLHPDGRFAFTLFPNDDHPDAVAVASLDGLGQTGCFRHGTDHVTQTAAANGLAVELMRRAPHEYGNGSPIEGLVVVLGRAG
ncbi:MAG: tetratricopeptide repeat protein [Bradyrhizobium sp.]|uniref:class I SAM-dependent DNA methyltransferase n=1 Tax=Bradyrhizobium sp. TaxID=376 RepID=UPI003D0F683B